MRLPLLQDETRSRSLSDADAFAAAPAPRPPVCFGADAAPSLAARDGAAAASAPRSTAPQQRAVQSGHRHERISSFILGTRNHTDALIGGFYGRVLREGSAGWEARDEDAVRAAELGDEAALRACLDGGGRVEATFTLALAHRIRC